VFDYLLLYSYCILKIVLGHKFDVMNHCSANPGRSNLARGCIPVGL